MAGHKSEFEPNRKVQWIGLWIFIGMMCLATPLLDAPRYMTKGNMSEYPWGYFSIVNPLTFVAAGAGAYLIASIWYERRFGRLRFYFAIGAALLTLWLFVEAQLTVMQIYFGESADVSSLPRLLGMISGIIVRSGPEFFDDGPFSGESKSEGRAKRLQGEMGEG